MDLDADITESYKVGFKAPILCKIKFTSIFQQQNRALTRHWTPHELKTVHPLLLLLAPLLWKYEEKH